MAGQKEGPPQADVLERERLLERIRVAASRVAEAHQELRQRQKELKTAVGDAARYDPLQTRMGPAA